MWIILRCQVCIFTIAAAIERLERESDLAISQRQEVDDLYGFEIIIEGIFNN